MAGAILSSVNHLAILLGTSSFTATGWQGSFYPKGLRPPDHLSYYALELGFVSRGLHHLTNRIYNNVRAVDDDEMAAILGNHLLAVLRKR